MSLLPAIEMPTGLKIFSKSFLLGYNQQINPMGAGFIQTIDRTVPLWNLEFKTPPLRDDNFDPVMAFIGLLQGSRNTFLGYDPRRTMPRAYQTQPITNDPWTQAGHATPIVTAGDFAGSTITLGQMLNGAIVTQGDYISYKIGNIWMLHMATATVVAAANAAIVPVAPAPYIAVTGNPVVRYRRAVAEFKIIPGSLMQDDQVSSLPIISFKAGQFINRT